VTELNQVLTNYLPRLVRLNLSIMVRYFSVTAKKPQLAYQPQKPLAEQLLLLRSNIQISPLDWHCDYAPVWHSSASLVKLSYFGKTVWQNSFTNCFMHG
jgi:hypothetical protein